MIFVYSSLCFVLYITASFLAYYIFNPKYRVIRVLDPRNDLSFRAQRLCWFIPFMYLTMNNEGKFELVFFQKSHYYGFGNVQSAEYAIREHLEKKKRRKENKKKLVLSVSNDGQSFINPNKEKED